MKKKAILSITLLSALLLTWGCDDKKPVEPTAISVPGAVTEATTGDPVPDVLINSGIETTTTDAQDSFDEGNNRADKTDSYDYLMTDEAKLKLLNNEI